MEKSERAAGKRPSYLPLAAAGQPSHRTSLPRPGGGRAVQDKLWVAEWWETAADWRAATEAVQGRCDGGAQWKPKTQSDMRELGDGAKWGPGPGCILSENVPRRRCQCVFCRGLDGQCACELNHYRLAHNEGCRALNIRDPHGPLVLRMARCTTLKDVLVCMSLPLDSLNTTSVEAAHITWMKPRTQ